MSYGVELAQYALQFIPYGYLIGNQIGIVYDTLVLPISDSVVYDLIIPVVNDPLNLASYVNGAVAVGSTTVNSFINFGIAEFNYFFGWLIPPIPPLPLAATAGHDSEARRGVGRGRRRYPDGTTDDTTVLAKQAATATDVVDADAPTAVKAADPAEPAATEEQTEPVQAEPADPATLSTPTETQTPAEPAPAENPTGDVVEAEPVASQPETEPENATGTTTTTTSTTSSSSSSNGVAAQGEVRGGTDGSPDAKPARGQEARRHEGQGHRQGRRQERERHGFGRRQARRVGRRWRREDRQGHARARARRQGHGQGHREGDGLGPRPQVAPQHVHRWRRTNGDEHERRIRHDAYTAEHDVTARAAERQARHRQQPGP